MIVSALCAFAAFAALTAAGAVTGSLKLENDDVVKRILKKRPAMRVEPLENLPEGADRTECGVHILPDRCNGCGPIYCARLVKDDH